MESVNLSDFVGKLAAGAAMLGQDFQKQYERGLWWRKRLGLARTTARLLQALVAWHRGTGYLPRFVLGWMRTRHNELKVADDPEGYRKRMMTVSTLGMIGGGLLSAFAFVLKDSNVSRDVAKD